jgi:FecR protein
MNLMQKILAGCVTIGIIAGHAMAADSKKEARVTQIIRDVKLLPSDAAARPAVVNDKVREDTGVRTGGDSRSELTFLDLTITRLGSNTIFSFNKAGRNVQLDSGSILLRVPKDSGGGAIRTSAVTVAVTGTTVIFESARGGKSKLIVLEGGARASLVKHSGQSQYVRAGQMLDVPAGATTMPLPTNIDLNQIMNSHPLITDFPPLPSRDLIVAASRQPPPPGPPPSGPSTFPILPVIDLLGGGLNIGPRGPRRNPPGYRTPPSPTPGPVVGRGPGPNKVPSTPPPVYRQTPGHTRVPPATNTQSSQPAATPKKRIPRKPKQSDNGPR